ncbi:hypothetical protein ABPG74_004378 [Tetrahymena malaccensis]
MSFPSYNNQSFEENETHHQILNDDENNYSNQFQLDSYLQNNSKPLTSQGMVSLQSQYDYTSQQNNYAQVQLSPIYNNQDSQILHNINNPKANNVCQYSNHYYQYHGQYIQNDFSQPQFNGQYQEPEQIQNYNAQFDIFLNFQQENQSKQSYFKSYEHIFNNNDEQEQSRNIRSTQNLQIEQFDQSQNFEFEDSFCLEKFQFCLQKQQQSNSFAQNQFTITNNTNNQSLNITVGLNNKQNQLSIDQQTLIKKNNFIGSEKQLSKISYTQAQSTQTSHTSIQQFKTGSSFNNSYQQKTTKEFNNNLNKSHLKSNNKNQENIISISQISTSQNTSQNNDAVLQNQPAQATIKKSKQKSNNCIKNFIGRFISFLTDYKKKVQNKNLQTFPSKHFNLPEFRKWVEDQIKHKQKKELYKALKIEEGIKPEIKCFKQYLLQQYKIFVKEYANSYINDSQNIQDKEQHINYIKHLLESAEDIEYLKQKKWK